MRVLNVYILLHYIKDDIMKLQRKQLIDEMQKAFAEVTDGEFLNKRVCGILIDVFATAITNVLVSGNDVNIRGFGTFKIKHRNSKAYSNPSKRGEKIIKPPTICPVFVAGKELTKAVKETFNYESKENIQEDD